jgi:hypothetical protein
MSEAQELFEHLKLNLLESSLIDQQSIKSNIITLNNQPKYEDTIDLTPYFDSYKVLKFDTPTYVSDDSYNLKKVMGISRLCQVLKKRNEEMIGTDMGLVMDPNALANVRIQMFSKLFGYEGSELGLLYYIYANSFNEWWGSVLTKSKLDLTKYDYPLLDDETTVTNAIRRLGQITLDIHLLNNIN